MLNVKDNPQDCIESLLCETDLQNVLQEDSDNILSHVKSAVTTINDGLKKYFQQGTSVNSIVYGRSRLIDSLLISVFNYVFSKVKQEISLIAVGGYGRGELHPNSDIDLMLLLRDKETKETKSAIETFITLLWDSRLEIGHSVRTIDDCIKESDADITVTTNLMESRLLAGNEIAFISMKKATGPNEVWDSQSFFQTKLEEQVQRSGKYNDTAYNLEPNIKESRGGLRDIQMIGWVAKRHFGATHLQDLVSHGFLRQDEFETLHNGQELLWKIRCSLHFMTNKREDRLLFDYQHQLALEFGFEDGDNNLAIELFMQQYYRTVIELEQLNEMLLQLFREAILYTQDMNKTTVLNDSFQSVHGYIEVRDDQLFSQRPLALLEIFLTMQQHPELQGVRAETIRLIKENKHLIDDEFRSSLAARRLFIDIIRQPRGVTHELRRMNRYGILAAYLPAFDKIVGRMQYDLFHAYTVDQHILFVVRNLRRYSVPDYCHEFPLASGIAHHIKKPELLYISGLFHDVAKGRNGDHSELGAVDAYEFCQNHNINQSDAELVSWLVKNHLLMSITAQRKDISDPEILTTFANIVGTVKYLDYLYLLTIADIRATNPKQWNNWKDNLLAELYNKTALIINKGLEYQTTRKENIHQNKTDSRRALDLHGISTQQIESLWSHFTEEYFMRHTPSEITWHTLLILNNNKNTPLIKTRLDEGKDNLELFVYTKTQNHLFAKIVNTLSQLSLNVANAHVIITNNNYSLETFRVLANTDIDHYLKNIIDELLEKLQKTLSTDKFKISEWKLPRSHKHFPVKTVITFEDNKNNTTRMFIDTVDRPGLLALISTIFVECGISIHSAYISTAGEKAIDYFDIEDKNTKSTLNATLKEKLKVLLLQQFDE